MPCPPVHRWSPLPPALAAVVGVTIAAFVACAPRAAAATSPVETASESGLVVTEHEIRPDPDGPCRFYLVAEPPGDAAARPAVVLLHGGSQSMRTILEPTAAPARWLTLAEKHGIVLLVPNGFNVERQDGGTDRQTWNDLRPPGRTPISQEDDVGFIAAMLEREAPRRRIDREAVFVTGSSNGGMMAHRLLVERPDLFAAGVSFIASLPAEPVPLPPRARPIMLVNGDADPLMPWEGGTVGFGGSPVRSTPATVAWFRAIHGLADVPPDVRLLPDRDPDDGTRILEAAFGGDDAMPPRLVLLRMIDAGHAMPVLPEDPQSRLPEPLLGVRCRDARGVDLAWAFLEAHRTGRTRELTRAEPVAGG